jgi:ribosomal protein S18 acetylase RimI-like enzyme
MARVTHIRSGGQAGADCDVAPLRADELGAAAELMAASWKAAYRGILEQRYLDDLSTMRWGDNLLSRYADSQHCALVLKLAGRIIGTSWFGPSATEGYLQDGEIAALYLLPEFIGSGYGHPLMQATLDGLRGLGYSHAVLDVLMGNERAIAFYRGLGFVVVNDDRCIEIDGATYPTIIMRLPL